MLSKEEPKTEQKNMKTKKIIGFTALIVIVAVIAATAFYIVNREQDEATSGKHELSEKEKKLAPYRAPDVIEYKVELKNLRRFKVKKADGEKK